jgi:hypothetical protein
MRFFKLSILIVFLLITGCASARSAEPITFIAHPDGQLYIGDQVSFEVLASTKTGNKTTSVEVTLGDQKLGSASFTPFGIGKRSQATLWWIWDTRTLKPGSYSLTFTILPDNTARNVTFTLAPLEQTAPPGSDAHWVSITTICCTLNYISSTAAQRDIAVLSQEADEQSAAVAAQMDTHLKGRMDIFIMSRVVGHGGFTWNNDIYVSYLDSNYISNDMPILFHHEMVHYYDSQLGGMYLPDMLQEGLAVYLTGGHFKPEKLAPRAAALLELGWYIPLTTIANDFYNQQHEIGYLEAGSLVQYLIETYGWKAFNKFYRNIPDPGSQTISSLLDTAFQDHFGVSFDNLEVAYLAYLRSQTVTEAERADLQVTVDLYNTVRRYQDTLDPSAYYLTAWLPDGAEMRQRGIVADLLRHPEGWKNRLLESFLVHSQRELLWGGYSSAEWAINWTNWVIDGLVH